MFNWLWKLLNKGKGVAIDVTSPVTDLWSYNYSLSFYVCRFKCQIDQVATALGLHNRFNPNRGCAELYDEWGILARVNVHGSEASPYEAVITSQQPLPISTRELFARAFSPLRIEFKESV